jgi:hypothetical protein
MSNPKRQSQRSSTDSTIAARLRRGSSYTLAAAMAGSLLLADPASAQESGDSADRIECASLSDPGLAVDSEALAIELAERCGRAVEVDSMRDTAARFTAQPSGAIEAEVYAVPQWTRDASGAWVDIDPSLIAEDGLIRADAIVGDLFVSPGGATEPLVRLESEDDDALELWWPEPLPEPDLEGAEAIYRDVFDGVDLVVEAGRDGFAYRLIVHDEAAAANPELTELSVDLDGTLAFAQDPATGVVTASDPETGETVFASAGALMWDSSGSDRSDAAEANSFFASDAESTDSGDRLGAPEPNRVEPVDVDLDGSTLTVVPDAAMLTDPGTVYPVVIDPSFDSPKWTWTPVGNGQHADQTWWDDAAWPRADGMRAGYQGWEAPFGAWRSMARFELRPLWGSTLESVRVELTVFHTANCESTPLQLWQTRAITANAVPTSWNSKAGDWLHGGPIATRNVPSANSTGVCGESYPDRRVSFSSDDLTHHVNRHVTHPYTSITFGLRTADETDAMQWVRSRADSMRLLVTYQPQMAAPGDLSIDDIACLAPEGARVAGARPVFSAVPYSSDGQARMTYFLRDAGTGATVQTHTSNGTVAAGEPYLWEPATDLPDGTYEWQVRANTLDGTTARYTTWCSFEVDATLDAIDEASDIELACPYDISGLDPAVDTLEAPSEGGALMLAEACGIGVEVTGERDFDTRVVADPEGFLTSQVNTVPVWAEDSDGEWGAVDTDFIVTADGTITTNAAVSDITVSSGGSEPFVTATSPEGESVSLFWPGKLPIPTVDGDTVTYPEVLDDVDLEVKSGIDGFTYALIVKTPQAAASPELASIVIDIEADGLTITADEEFGGINLVDDDGEIVYGAPVAYMWDSSLEPDGADTDIQSFAAVEDDEYSDLDAHDPMPGRYAEVDIELADGSFTMTPDADLLADPDAEYPIVIDPAFVGKRLAWANLFKNRPSTSWTSDKDWPRDAGMRVGYLNWAGCQPSACGLWRSVVKFDTSGLKGKDILTANVSMTQTHTGSCGSTDLQLWELDRNITNGTTWNAVESSSSTRLETKSVASSNSTGCATKYPNRDVIFKDSAVKSRVQSRVNSGRSWMSFVVRSANESSGLAWRRIDIKSVELQVTYNSRAQAPISLRTNGKACVSSGYGDAPWTSEVQPTLSGVPRDPDGKVGARIQVRQRGSSDNIRTWSIGTSQKSHERQSWTVPSSRKLPSGQYRWRMASRDNYSSAPDVWTENWCYFKIDATAPTVPKIELVSPANPKAGDTVTFRLTSSDAHSGIGAFHWGVNEEAKRDRKTSSGTTTISITAPSSGGFTWLYVWAQDKAGNTSKRAQVDFFAPRNIQPVPAGAWRLDRDGLDDSGGGNDLNMGRTSGWTGSGSSSPVGDAMVFNGSDCVSTEGPVIRTDVPYTVATWVRLDATGSGVQRMISQAGSKQSGFDLGYRASSNTWEIVTPTEDLSSTPLPRLDSTAKATVGRWTHVAATVDPGGKALQLWVDGNLQGTRSISHEAWHADGPLHIGCSSTTDPRRQFNNLTGAVQHAGVWQGLLTTAQIRKVMKGDLPAGLAGEWLLRGDGDDSSPHGRPVTVPNNAQLVDDQWGRQRSALKLDGTSCVTAGNSVANRSGGSFSVSAWVKVDDVATGTEHTVAGEAWEGGSKFKLMLNSSGRWSFAMTFLNSQGGTTWVSANASGMAVPGEWVHLTGVYDAAAGRTFLYVDGVQAGSATLAHDPHSGNGKVNIGCRGTSSGGEGGGHFVGVISDVQLWRGAVTGAQAAQLYGGNKAAQRQANWDLNWQSLADSDGRHPLSLHGGRWGRDRWFPNCALEFQGSGWAQTAGPVVRTDESFTVAAWIKLDNKQGDYQTFLSQAGDRRVGFNLNYHAAQDRFQFAMPSVDVGTATWHSVYSTESPAVGQWYHVAVVVDIPAGEMRMYVGGEHVATGTGTASPWNADGPLFLGTAGRKNADYIQHIHGSIDRVQVWQSTVDPDRIADMALSTPRW